MGNWDLFFIVTLYYFGNSIRFLNNYILTVKGLQLPCYKHQSIYIPNSSRKQIFPPWHYFFSPILSHYIIYLTILLPWKNGHEYMAIDFIRFPRYENILADHHAYEITSLFFSLQEDKVACPYTVSYSQNTCSSTLFWTKKYSL